MIFDLAREDKSIIKVLGVGGGGSNAVNHMFNQGIVGVDFAICNTDAQAMEASPVPTKLQLGPSLTEGRGAGSLPSVGKEACLESIEDIRVFLEDDTKMLFVTAGMGGGTGTGAAPIIAKTAKEMGILTVAIVTLPFSFEGNRRISQGAEGLEELKNSVDTLVIISNDKLRALYGNSSLTNAFSNADNILTTAAKGIAEIITVGGLVNVDFADVNTVMKDSGVAIMGTASAKGEARAIEAVDKALNSPLLEDNNIRGAQHILINIASGNKEVTMDEISEITEFVQEEAGYGTDLIWGNCFDSSLDEELSVTVIATGFDRNNVEKVFGEPKENKVILTLDDPKPSNISRITTGATADSKSEKVVVFDNVMDKMKKKSEEYQFNNSSDRKSARSELDTNVKKEREMSRIQKMRAGRKNAATPDNFSQLEKQPAYLRRGVNIEDEDLEAKEKEMSSWTVEDSSGRIELHTNNSYLHDNVD